MWRSVEGNEVLETGDQFASSKNPTRWRGCTDTIDMTATDAKSENPWISAFRTERPAVTVPADDIGVDVATDKSSSVYGNCCIDKLDSFLACLRAAGVEAFCVIFSHTHTR